MARATGAPETSVQSAVFQIEMGRGKKVIQWVLLCLLAATVSLIYTAGQFHSGLNKREAKDMVEAFFEVIRDALESGDSVKLSGFGNFQLRDKPQRPGRNPKTGEAIPIAARRVVTFHASQKLKALVETGAEASFAR